MNNYIIYDHISPNGRHYIGQTKRSTTARWGKNGQHYLNRYKDGQYTQPAFAAAIEKYGWDNFQHKVLFTDLTKLEADMIEQDLIFYYKKEGLSYNIAAGGEGCSIKRFTNEELKEHRKQYGKKWYEENKEAHSEWAKEYREKHKEELAAKAKAYYEANKEKLLAQSAQYYLEHKADKAERRREYDHQRWANMDPEKKYISCLRQRKAYKELPEDERVAWIQQQVKAWKESRL